MAITVVKNGWKVDVSRKGKRIRRTITTSKADANAFERLAIEHLETGKPLGDPKKPTGTTMGSLYSLAYTLHWSKHKSSSQSRTAKNFFDIMGCNNSLVEDALTQEQINKFELLCASKGYSEGTISKYKSAIKILVDISFEHGLIKNKPIIKIGGKGRRRKHFLSKDDEDKFLLEALNKGNNELYDIAVFAIDTGCRVSELLSLTKEAYNNETILLKDTKNGESRLIPLTNRANKIIQDRLDCDKIFNLSYEQIKYQWRMIRISLGYNDDYCFHVCRHTFATRLLMSNNPTPMVALLTGHKSLDSLKGYAHANQEHLRSMINTLN